MRKNSKGLSLNNLQCSTGYVGVLGPTGISEMGILAAIINLNGCCVYVGFFT